MAQDRFYARRQYDRVKGLRVQDQPKEWTGGVLRTFQVVYETNNLTCTMCGRSPLKGDTMETVLDLIDGDAD